MVSWVNEIAASAGLSINIETQTRAAPLEINRRQLEGVDSFKYLGARPLSTGQSKDDIVSQIDADYGVFSIIRKRLWIRRDLSIAMKIRVYRIPVLPVFYDDMKAANIKSDSCQSNYQHCYLIYVVVDTASPVDEVL
ncbi:unnamed protein product [Dibothriocephalus latus]|uniref:Uncharacterized protein n=1 Tax=Dibothriocephalus latus TaxID=60516 RepID=A0A3P6UWB3_DIBLA|nr:unnamed protein product [Dibothriocephalus latus]